MKLTTLLWLGAAIVIGVLAMNWFRADYLEFDKDREAWHRRCDAYVGRPVAPGDIDIAESCKRELEQLTGYAKRKGWR